MCVRGPFTMKVSKGEFVLRLSAVPTCSSVMGSSNVMFSSVGSNASTGITLLSDKMAITVTTLLCTRFYVLKDRFFIASISLFGGAASHSRYYVPVLAIHAGP